jgi:hypothetical protein
MDVPILVAVISVIGSLSGTIVGGCIVTGGTYFLARRREKVELRTARRLIAAELQDANHTVKFAIESKRWWHSHETLSTEAWKQYKSILAPNLSYDAWSDVRIAVGGINHANALAAAPRPTGETEDVLLVETIKALTLISDHIETSRVKLMPHLR